tara:strand:- start:229 stop:954 length:726 start_codon:yes stop_codon:yes gene_type:complete
MVTKSLINQIQKLKLKKFRYKTGLFVAEGEKLVKELLNSNLACNKLFTTDNYNLFSAVKINLNEMQKLTHFKNASNFLGIFEIPKHSNKLDKLSKAIIILDGISDPGNFGSIIRTCDWFGIHDIVCSENSVDCFNSKVVQSSMGSILKVRCHYTNLVSFIKKTKIELYGTALDGKSIYDLKLNKNSVFLFGNESKGISLELQEHINSYITIPKNQSNASIDSLNLASSVAIILSERYRQIE